MFRQYLLLQVFGFISSCFQFSGFISKFPFKLFKRNCFFLSEAFAIEKQFHFFTIGVTLNIYWFPFFTRPIPMRKQVNNRCICPSCLVCIISIFREAAYIHESKMRGNTRPLIRRGFTSIIESCPYKYSSKKRILNNICPVFTGKRPPVGFPFTHV